MRDGDAKLKGLYESASCNLVCIGLTFFLPQNAPCGAEQRRRNGKLPMKKFGKDLQPNTAEHPAGTAPQTAQQLSVQLRLAKTTVKLAAVLLVLIPAVVVYLSSAWFARNTEVTGGGASVSVVKPGASLYIAAGNTVPTDNHATTAEIRMADDLYPISTNNCTDWWYITGGVGTAETFEKATAQTYTYNNKEYTAYSAGSYILYTDGEPLDVYLGTGGITLTSTGAAGKSLSEALRVGIKTEKTLLIYAPVQEDGGYKAVTGTNTTADAANVYDGTTISAWQVTQTEDGYTVPANKNKLATATSDGTPVQIYVWLEGTDAQAILSKSDNASGLKLSVYFTGVEAATP